MMFLAHGDLQTKSYHGSVPKSCQAVYGNSQLSVKEIAQIKSVKFTGYTREDFLSNKLFDSFWFIGCSS